MTEAGLVLKWTQDEILKTSKPEEEGNGSSGKGPGSLTLDHMQSTFYLLGIGFFCAGTALMFEYCIARCCCPRD